MRRFGIFILLLYKRLFKKASFALILLLIPCMILAVKAIDGGDSGAVTVALAALDAGDETACEIISSLLDSSDLIRFTVYESEAQAREAVEENRADSAWVFHLGLEEKIDKFTQNMHRRNAFVTVIQREDNVLLKLSREKLYSALYPYTSYSLYESFTLKKIPSALDMSEDEIRSHYDKIDAEGGDLFDISYADMPYTDGESVGYLLSPMRGLFSLVILLGGFAAAIFFMQDRSDGVFDAAPLRLHPIYDIAYQLTAVSLLSIAVLFALFISGIATSFVTELLLMLLYMLAVALFCMALKQLCVSVHILGAVIPAVMLISVALCPVFFNVSGAEILQYLLPPYYYLSAVYDASFFIPMLIYIAVLSVFNLAVYKIKSINK